MGQTAPTGVAIGVERYCGGTDPLAACTACGCAPALCPDVAATFGRVKYAPPRRGPAGTGRYFA
ncbi:hypothetical protein LDL36_08940 [Komagataeibacter sp. FNDCR1]|nr:hypothetical protein [Komagataeibacter sp. FNDCR1]MCW4581516.1 hypothetical protein [Gluconacetobacter entanii]MCW4584896.1 hypothetical protein [Gluconacetobacter entanii]MCW4588309.1 hypothetical protein [Gluconacetobacter entanii]